MKILAFIGGKLYFKSKPLAGLYVKTLKNMSNMFNFRIPLLGISKSKPTQATPALNVLGKGIFIFGRF